MLFPIQLNSDVTQNFLCRLCLENCVNYVKQDDAMNGLLPKHLLQLLEIRRNALLKQPVKRKEQKRNKKLYSYITNDMNQSEVVASCSNEIKKIESESGLPLFKIEQEVEKSINITSNLIDLNSLDSIISAFQLLSILGTTFYRFEVIDTKANFDQFYES